MSGFRAYMREQLARKKPSWAGEWDGVFKDGGIDATLEGVRKLGADPEFCVFVLAEYRWREIRPLRPRWLRVRLLTAVTTLLNLDGDWAEILGHRGLGSREVKQFLAGAYVTLRGARAVDEGAFSRTTTDKDQVGWEKERQSTCLSVLRRHILHASRRRRVPQRILAELLSDFGLSPVRSTDLGRLMEKRLERSDRKGRVPLLPLYHSYHLLHLEAGTHCTRVCRLPRLAKDQAGHATRGRDHVFLGRPVGFVERAAEKISDPRGHTDDA